MKRIHIIIICVIISVTTVKVLACVCGTNPVTCMTKGDVITSSYDSCGLSCPHDLETINFDCTGNTCKACIPKEGDPQQGNDNWDGQNGNIGTKTVEECDCDETGCHCDIQTDVSYTCQCNWCFATGDTCWY